MRQSERDSFGRRGFDSDMIRVKILAVGKIKESFHREEIGEYVKRLSRYCKLSVTEIEEEKIRDTSEASVLQALDREGESLLNQIKEEDFVVLLDLRGKEMSSEEFAGKVEELANRGKSLVFVIGSSYGLSDILRKRSDLSLSLSKMTFTHQLTRVLILEQIYRSFKIICRETYHK